MKYYYCFSSKSNLFGSEIEYAKKLGLIIFYDDEKDVFLDDDNNEVNIKDMLIFPRSSIKESKKLVDAIDRHGGNSLLKIDDYDKTLNWPYYVKTKRNNIILSGSAIISNPQLIIDIFGKDRVFFKTKHKNFSGIVKVSKILDKKSAFYLALGEHLDDDFIISDAVTIDTDENGPLEYRAFVVNEEIFNISRVSGNLLSSIPKEIITKLKSIIDSFKETDFPKSYVIDLFVYTAKSGKKVIDVLECNPIIASGTYLYNSIFEKSTDLEHKCPSRTIPKEKISYSKSNGYNYSFNVTNNTSPSIFYNLPGGFAADLTSYTLFGTKSRGSTCFHFDGSSIPINTIELKPFEDSISDDTERLESIPRVKTLSRVKEEYCSRR